MIRTRFAPSPTGYLHIGGARTALFSWAYARKHGGKFILRIEDTDLERSTQASEQAILDGMTWLGIDWDEGPFYQMQRLDRYRQVVEKLLADGRAYPCYASKEELETMREAQKARGDKPRYDGRWRPEPGRMLPTPPAGVTPVIRFRNPVDGEVTFDDLVIMRADGVPTYNFGVVVDDIDMNMTHVIRGDDHVNNTPRQINIFRALGANLPRFAHVPMILGHDGERLSKRHGAVGVMQYHDDGYLPAALVNYLARLGWSHGDAEVFSKEQLVEWFDLEHISRSPAKLDPEKMLWMNAHYMKESAPGALSERVRPLLVARGCDPSTGPSLDAVVALLQSRASLLPELADAAIYFYRAVEPPADIVAQHLTVEAIRLLEQLVSHLHAVDWTREAIGAGLKDFGKAHGVKLGAIGVPLRVAICGTTHTPSIDATLELIGRDESLARLTRHLHTHAGKA